MGQGTGPYDYLDLGTWNAVCSMCGRKRKADKLVRNWQGLYRCPEHDEERQPQDFARGVPDNMSVPWAQEPDDEFVYTCTFNGSSGIPGYALAGCMVPGRSIILPPTVPGS